MNLKQIILATCTLMVATQVQAQVKKFAKSITEKELKKHLYYIAGPECEGRGTGTPGIAKAAAYIENNFKEAGLVAGAKEGYQMTYYLIQDSITSSSISINGKLFNINESYSSNRVNQNQNATTAEAVYAGYGINDAKHNDYANINVKGKIVVVEPGEPFNADSTYKLSGTKTRSDWGSPTLDKKAKAAKDAGAIALFVISKNHKPATVWPQRRSTGTPEFRLDLSSLNRYQINSSMVTEMFGTDVPTLGNVSNKTTEIKFTKDVLRIPSTNVVGIVEGSDKKEEYLIITAHMDHLGKNGDVIYYGADDDGSGTCAVMEMAEAFAKAKKAGKGPRRTVVFMTVSGEERGLWGSAYYAQNPIFPLDKTTCNLNIDMIGRVGSDYLKDAPDSLNYVYVIGDDKLSSDLRPINEAANSEVGLKLDYRYNDPNDKNRFYYRSDHYNFAQKGVPIIFYFDGVHADYHRATDTPDKINYDMYARRARLVFYTAWEMANRDQMLKRDIPLN